MTKRSSAIISTNQNSPKSIHTISSCHKQAEIIIGNTKIQALVDTGAEVNILLESNVPHHIRRIFHIPITLQPYDSTIITPKGQVTFNTTWNIANKRATWIFIDDKDLQGNPCNLIPCTLAESLGITSFNESPRQVSAISCHNSGSQPKNHDFESLKSKTQPTTSIILSKYENFFAGLGKLKAQPVHFHLKANARPIIQP